MLQSRIKIRSVAALTFRVTTDIKYCMYILYVHIDEAVGPRNTLTGRKTKTNKQRERQTTETKTNKQRQGQAETMKY